MTVPSVLTVTIDGAIAHLTFNRPEKRNAVNDDMLAALRRFYDAPPAGVRVVILSGAGGHFSAGLDLGEQVHREAPDVFAHSRGWHALMDRIQFSGLPVVAVLNGAVMGGGLEIASACHVRIAEPDARLCLPEGQRGIFVGGGATVRVGGIIGADRMVEMMLTGRICGAEEAERIGLVHRIAGPGEGVSLARRLAQQIASNAPGINRMIIEAIPHIAKMGREGGLYAESLAAALSTVGPDAEEGLAAFLEKRPPRFG